MAKHDWNKLQQAFDEEHERTGIAAKEWCEKAGINYNSARRYLKTRGQSPAQPKKSRVAAQTAQSNAQKTAHSGAKLRNKRNAQTAQCADSETHESQARQGIDEDEASSTAQTENCAGPETKNNMVGGRNCAGRFTDGHRESVGNSGNPNPPRNIKPGMQLAKTHGGYAKYLVDKDAPEAFDDAREMRLRDELVFVRTRALLSTRHLSTLRDDLGACDDIEQRIRIYESITATEEALDRSMARIESIERTLSGIRIDDVREPHISAAARKLEAETRKLEKDGDSDSTPIGEVAQELQEIGTGGLMS